MAHKKNPTGKMGFENIVEMFRLFNRTSTSLDTISIRPFDFAQDRLNIRSLAISHSSCFFQSFAHGWVRVNGI